MLALSASYTISSGWSFDKCPSTCSCSLDVGVPWYEASWIGSGGNAVGMCEDNGFLMPLLDILLDKLRICKGISYAAVAAHVDKSGRRQLAAMLVEYKCSSTNHWRGRYRSVKGN